MVHRTIQSQQATVHPQGMHSFSVNRHVTKVWCWYGVLVWFGFPFTLSHSHASVGTSWASLVLVLTRASRWSQCVCWQQLHWTNHGRSCPKQNVA
jgi:hypothetical protein